MCNFAAENGTLPLRNAKSYGMVHNIFKGLGIALITPFKEDGSVDYESLIRLIDYQLNNGADFFCILATTGETPTLTPAEKLKIKDTVVDYVQARVPILMGCGGYNTAAVVEELKTGDFRGVDGILSICPYYNKPSQEGLYQHFKAISAATKLPIVMYNVPGRTGVNMQAATTVRLARDCQNIVAIKEASGNLEQVDEIIKNKPNDFDVISGDVCRCVASMIQPERYTIVSPTSSRCFSLMAILPVSRRCFPRWVSSRTYSVCLSCRCASRTCSVCLRFSRN